MAAPAAGQSLTSEQCRDVHVPFDKQYISHLYPGAGMVLGQPAILSTVG